MMRFLFCDIVPSAASVFWMENALHNRFAQIEYLLHVTRAWRMHRGEGHPLQFAFVTCSRLLSPFFFYAVGCAKVTPTRACKITLVNTCVAKWKKRDSVLGV